jgi:hypothetical protein
MKSYENWLRAISPTSNKGGLSDRPITLFELNNNVLKFPSLAKNGLDELFGLIIIGEAHVIAVPQQFFVRESPAYRSP